MTHVQHPRPQGVVFGRCPRCKRTVERDESDGTCMDCGAPMERDRNGG